MEVSRNQVARSINSEMVLLYWNVGKRIRDDILHKNRAQYGEQIVSSLVTQLSWTHFREIIYIDDQLKRDFYVEMCRVEQWSTRFCADKCEEHIQLLRVDESGIRVARYLTQLPPKDLLRKKLQEAVMLARKQLESRLNEGDVGHGNPSDDRTR